MRRVLSGAVAIFLVAGSGCSKGGNGAPGSPGAGPTVSGPLDLSAVMRSVHFAYRAHGAAFDGGHESYDVAVDERGAFQLTPRLRPADMGTSAGAAGAPARLETTAIARGGTPVAAGGGAPGLDRDGSLWTPRGAVVERLRNGEDGVEQTWLFSWQPEGEGDLTVRVRVAGLDYAGQTGAGLHFLDPATGLGVRYGKAFWVDHVGQTTELAARYEGEEVVLTVPASVLATTVFPAVLDPLIGPELGIDQPITYAWTPAEPAAASSGTGWFVAWADRQRGGVWGARVDAAGNVLDPAGLLVSPGQASVFEPAVSFGAGLFLVAWTADTGTTSGTQIFFRRAQVGTGGVTWADGAPVALAQGGTANGGTHAAFDAVSARFLVVWTRGGTGVVGARVPVTGAAVDANVLVIGAGGDHGCVADAPSNGRLLVAWRASGGGVQASRVNAGAATPVATPVTVSTTNVTGLDVVLDGTSWLVVGDNPAGHLWGKRVATNNGAVRESADVQLTSSTAGAQFAPALAWNGTDFVVAWLEDATARRVFVGRVDVVGGGGGTLTPREAAGILVGTAPDNGSGGVARLGLAAAGATSLVAWPTGRQVVGVRLPVYPGGTLDGTPRVFSAPPTQAESRPAVASDGTGYLVVWQDARNAGTSDVYGALVSGSGAVQGAAFAVSATASGETAPAVAFDGTSYLVVWEDGASSHVRGARVSRAGAVLDAAGFGISSGSGAQREPRVAFGGGNHLVVWTDLTAGDVYGARVSPAGVVLDPAGFAIAAGAGSQQRPDVATDAAGFVVTWQDDRNGTQDVYGARVSGSGAVLDPVGVAIATGAGDQTAPAVGCGGGTCLVAWSDGASTDVRAARLVGGALQDAAGLAVAAASGLQQRPAVVFDGRDFAIAFEDGRSGGGTQVWGNRVSTGGAVLDGTGVALATEGGTVPRLAAGAAGTALLVHARPDPAVGNVDRVAARLLTYRNAITLGKAGSGTGGVTSSPAGLDCPGGCAGAVGSFDAPGSVTLTATPDANMSFGGWSGDCSGTGPCTFTTDVARSVTATFNRIDQTLTVSRTGSGSGTVNASPGPVSCGATCSGPYLQGTSVTLTASPAAGSTFAGWTGGCTGTDLTCTVTMGSAVGVTATFDTVSYAITATASAGGSVAFSPDGRTTTCGADCWSFTGGTVVILTAQPASGYQLTGWAGDCASAGTATTCTVLADRARSASVQFAPVPPGTYGLTVTRSGTGTGSVSSQPGGISCGASCSADFPSGTPVVLTASPLAGSSFAGWSGSACTGTGTCTVTMDQARSVDAAFAPAPASSYLLSVTKGGSGAGTVSSQPAGIACGPTCAASFAAGTPVTLTASAATGSVFGGWWGGGCAGTGTCTVAMDTVRSVTATFASNGGSGPASFALVTEAGGPGSGTVTATDPALGLRCTVGRGRCVVDVARTSPPAVVTLVATPGPGSRLAWWTDACSGTGACTLPMDRPQLARAVFVPAHAQLAVTLAGQGSGTIATEPAGLLACVDGACIGQLPTVEPAAAPVVRLTARPDAGSSFQGWAGESCAGAGSCDVALDRSRALTAYFIPAQVPLTVLPLGAGSGRVWGDGLDCTSGAAGTCTVPVSNGSPPAQVTLTAQADADSVFLGWSGDCGTSPTCTVTVGGPTWITATFAPRFHDVAVQLIGRGTGTVVASNGLTCTGSMVECVGTASGVVVFEAIPASGSHFVGWGGVCPQTSDPQCTVDFIGTGIVQAVFEPDTFSLQVQVNGPGSVSGGGIDCSAAPGAACSVDVPCTSPPGQVTLAAQPSPGSVFWGWSGACTGNGACTVTMDGAKSVMANFLPGT